jgi:hypothetical protein
MRRIALLLAFTFLFAQRTFAEEPGPTLPDAVRKAVAAGQVLDSENLGDRAAEASYREVGADGGVLVGFEAGMARWFDREIPYALRPVYRKGDREWVGSTAGNMYANEVIRQVRVAAKPGYAVGGMWIRTGAAMDRVRLLYMRIDGGHLNPDDSYKSEFIGNSEGGSEHYIDGRGRPVAGIFAVEEQRQLRTFGLTYVRVPLPPPKPKDSLDKSKTAGPVPAAKSKHSAARADDPESTPAEEFDFSPAKKSKLELEEDARRQDEDRGEERSAAVLGVLLLGAIGVPLGIVGFFVLRQKEPAKASREAHRDRRRDDRRGPRPSRPQMEGGPSAERPELAKRLQPYLPEAVPTTNLATASLAQRPEADPPPPFFLVRATYRARYDRMTRIYVLPDELLVIDAGPGADYNMAAGYAAAAVVGGGVLGAFIGKQAAMMVADNQKTGGEVIQQRLDRLDLPTLLVYATEQGNFRARWEELVGIAVESRGPRTRGVGIFRFRHLRRGEYSFEFLNGAEIRGAIELLRGNAKGNNIHVGSGWDEATAPYLADL